MVVEQSAYAVMEQAVYSVVERLAYATAGSLGRIDEPAHSGLEPAQSGGEPAQSDGEPARFAPEPAQSECEPAHRGREDRLVPGGAAPDVFPEFRAFGDAVHAFLNLASGFFQHPCVQVRTWIAQVGARTAQVGRPTAQVMPRIAQVRDNKGARPAKHRATHPTNADCPVDQTLRWSMC